MNNKTLAKIGFGLFGISTGLLLSEIKYSKELKEMLDRRAKLMEEHIALLDEATESYKKNIEVRDEVINKQAEVIAKLDPDLAAKFNRIENIKLVK